MIFLYFTFCHGPNPLSSNILFLHIVYYPFIFFSPNLLISHYHWVGGPSSPFIIFLFYFRYVMDLRPRDLFCFAHIFICLCTPMSFVDDCDYFFCFHFDYDDHEIIIVLLVLFDFHCDKSGF